jgi:hypothetical protein
MCPIYLFEAFAKPGCLEFYGYATYADPTGVILSETAGHPILNLPSANQIMSFYKPNGDLHGC